MEGYSMKRAHYIERGHGSGYLPVHVQKRTRNASLFVELSRTLVDHIHDTDLAVASEVSVCGMPLARLKHIKLRGTVPQVQSDLDDTYKLDNGSNCRDILKINAALIQK